MAATAKTFSYTVDVSRDGRGSPDGGPASDVPRGWKPEHLLLAGLVRCTLASLRYHARRSDVEVVSACGSASGRVTKRETDERYAFVEVECALEVELEPAPRRTDLAELLAKAERDCFVGASLTSTPRYTWRVNAEPFEPS